MSSGHRVLFMGKHELDDALRQGRLNPAEAVIVLFNNPPRGDPYVPQLLDLNLPTVLQVTAWDLDMTAADCERYNQVSVKGQEVLPEELFNKAKANLIYDHVAGFEETGFLSTYIACCEAGISRSAACAKFIAEFLPPPTPFNHTYPLYNKAIYRLLTSVKNERMMGRD